MQEDTWIWCGKTVSRTGGTVGAYFNNDLHTQMRQHGVVLSTLAANPMAGVWILGSRRPVHKAVYPPDMVWLIQLVPGEARGRQIVGTHMSQLLCVSG